MNERIKEFRFKAAGYANEQKPLGITKWNEMRDEKFAELIVKECLNIALKSGSVSNKSEVAVAEADRIYHKIQEHFGVEE